MTRRNLAPVTDVSQVTLPIEFGGTGTNSLTKAAANLNLVTSALKDMPNGVVSLNASGVLSQALATASISGRPVNLDGDFNVYSGSTVTFTLTDYDMFKNYTLSASAGTISRVADIVTYVAPVTAQAVSITVNGRVINFTVSSPAPATPSITSPTTGAIDRAVTGLQLTSSAFQALGGTFTHLNSDWQVAADSAFTNVVSQSLADATNKVSWTIPTTLNLNTVYYARVRYRGSNNNVSSWSTVITFTTRAFNAAAVEEAKIYGSNRSASGYFGFTVDMSGDGLRAIVGSVNDSYIYVFVRNAQNNTWSIEYTLNTTVWNVSIDSTGTRIAIGTLSSVQIYRRSGGTWSFEQSITGGGQYGIGVDFDETATRIVIGSNNVSYMEIYVRSGTTWTYEQRLQPGTITLFGSMVAMSGDGLRVAGAGFYGSTASGIGKVAIYSRPSVTTSWSLEATLQPTTTSTTDDYFGGNLAFSTDSSRLIISARYNDSATGFIDSGCVYVFSRSGPYWSQEAVLTADNPAVSAIFGAGADINGDGNVIVVGSNSSGGGNVCTLYIFTRTNTTWTLVRKIRPSDAAAGDTRMYAESWNYRIVAMARNDSRVIYGAIYGDVLGTTDCGAAYIMA